MPAGSVVEELTVAKVVAGGDGLAHGSGGKAVFVAGALPGERVRARVVESRRDFDRAELVEVLDAHAGRVSPPCPYVAAGCGGCTWQHVAPGVQRELKVAIVREALARTGALPDAGVSAGVELAPFGFRTTLRLAAAPDGRLGFRGRRSHDVVPVEHCLVAHPHLDELLVDVRATPGSEVTLRLGVASGERSALVEPAATDRSPSRGRARREVRPPTAPPAVSGLPSDVAIGPDARVHETVDGVSLQVSARSFFQTRHDGAAALVEAVRRAAVDAPAEGLFVDAYGGVGLFSATLAGAGRPVVVVESSASSCADAAANLHGRDAQVIAARVERWGSQAAAGLVVADPSRSGLGREAVGVLAATAAPVLVLVSCDPVSLARDARLLAEHGYHHAGSEVIDLFAHTPHVEVVTRFVRAAP